MDANLRIVLPFWHRTLCLNILLRINQVKLTTLKCLLFYSYQKFRSCISEVPNSWSQINIKLSTCLMLCYIWCYRISRATNNDSLLLGVFIYTPEIFKWRTGMNWDSIKKKSCLNDQTKSFSQKEEDHVKMDLILHTHTSPFREKERTVFPA